MTLTNCPKCGKVFARMSNPLCDECAKEEEELYKNVKMYLADNPDVPLEKVSEETGASKKKIIKYIKDGKIEVTPGLSDEIKLSCRKCGKPITIGGFCDGCIISMNQQVADMRKRDMEKKFGRKRN